MSDRAARARARRGLWAFLEGYGSSLDIHPEPIDIDSKPVLLDVTAVLDDLATIDMLCGDEIDPEVARVVIRRVARSARARIEGTDWDRKQEYE